MQGAIYGCVPTGPAAVQCPALLSSTAARETPEARRQRFPSLFEFTKVGVSRRGFSGCAHVDPKWGDLGVGVLD